MHAEALTDGFQEIDSRGTPYQGLLKLGGAGGEVEGVAGLLVGCSMSEAPKDRGIGEWTIR
jgi:hypothetical protein